MVNTSLRERRSSRAARVARRIYQDEAARPTVRRGPMVGGGAGQMPQAAPKPEDARKPETYRREMPKVGRNDPCPCGSGKKYKNCCMNKDLEQ